VREVNHPKHVAFRADAALVAALDERAALAGVTVSDFLRTIALRSVVPEPATTDERNGHEAAIA